jgi:hypothetical protein
MLGRVFGLRTASNPSLCRSQQHRRVLQCRCFSSVQLILTLSSNKTLQVFNISHNGLDKGSVWRLLDTVEKSSLHELHADQEDLTIDAQLLDKLCGLFYNSKTLQRLYFSVDVPSDMVVFDLSL